MASHCYRRIVLQGVSKIEGESVLRLVPSYILQIRSSSSTVLSSSKNRGVQFDSSSPVFPNERKEAAKKSVASLWYSFQLLNHHHHHRRCRRCFSSFSSLNNDKGYTIDIQGTIPRNGQGVEVGQYAQVCGIMYMWLFLQFPKVAGWGSVLTTVCRLFWPRFHWFWRRTLWCGFGSLEQFFKMPDRAQVCCT